MKRTLFLLALMAATAAPVFAQDANEFGVIVSGSRRFVKGAPHPNENDFIESNFSFSNNSVELYWSIPIEPELNLRFKGGRMETEIAIPYDLPDTRPDHEGKFITNRRDVEGQVAHVETEVEYTFDEPYGSSGLFAGLGYYRMSADSEKTLSTWGVTAGVNSDFPLSRRYGVVLQAAYHWTHAEFQPRFLTLGAGMRVSF